MCASVDKLSRMEQHDLVLQGASKGLIRDVLDSYEGLELRLRRLLNVRAAGQGGAPSTRVRRLQAEYLLDLVDVTRNAIGVFGSRDAAEQWLTNPVCTLDGRIPVDLLVSRLGAIAVKDHLIRVDYGIYT